MSRIVRAASGDHRHASVRHAHGNLDYSCTTGLSAQVIAESAKALRSDASLVPYLRLRITDLETRLVDLTSNNRDIVEHLRAIAQEKP